ncbi:ABC-2 type transport system permease protein [Allocatelliglobosispora scoriae]|uniref:ABC-2 type transport system permease protein n=1 Tax=Allocatelliglobosispora scoriae TaxID=643052 RepID=A0A841BRY9_9ACTN|nr:ABC-2 family transporter protein [Allocatelliglobosispora scoriae]MBB5869492.1 ABC-2 type transport system permease protein [Allocatelliglobosispora scoriae]
MFGFLRSYVMIAVTVVGGAAAGYSEAQLLSFVWLGQGLLGVLLLWGWNDLADRIRSGDVVMDLLRPQHPVVYFLAADLGRAAYAFLTRFFAPMLVGALCFTLYVPQRWPTYPLGAASIVLGVVISFGCRYLVNAASFWLMDSRGVNLVWLVCSGLLAGLYFPLRFLPEPLLLLIWIGTPMPSMLQAPLDVLVERDGLTGQLAIVGGQIAWAAALIGLCFLVQRRAERKLVVQGG